MLDLLQHKLKLGEVDESDLRGQDLLQTYKFKSALMLVPQLGSDSETETGEASLVQV